MANHSAPFAYHVGPPGSWAEQAACIGADGDLFFPPKKCGPLPYEAARAICQHCPVIADCLEYALKNRIRDGLWGGMTPYQRAHMRHPAGGTS